MGMTGGAADSPRQPEAIAEKAHAFCPCSKAARGNTKVEVTVTDD
ncbi:MULTISPECIES: hypothetical protein [unclassified Nesterenkonia]|nr:hypothetical protein [Nesterenkonia sp. DZ6]